ncbi:MAG: hypothetical protein Q9166_006355 [cf. Caloplaca sp. 2 TL-2023]
MPSKRQRSESKSSGRSQNTDSPENSSPTLEELLGQARETKRRNSASTSVTDQDYAMEDVPETEQLDDDDHDDDDTLPVETGPEQESQNHQRQLHNHWPDIDQNWPNLSKGLSNPSMSPHLEEEFEATQSAFQKAIWEADVKIILSVLKTYCRENSARTDMEIVMILLKKFRGREDIVPRLWKEKEFREMADDKVTGPILTKLFSMGSMNSRDLVAIFASMSS